MIRAASTTTLAFLLAGSVALAQHVELTGKVTGPDGSPVPAARIGFQSLRLPPPPLPGIRSAYTLAQRLHLAKTRLPRTVTDRDGEWRVMLTPEQAALATSGLSRFLMTVDSKTHASWQRCIEGDLRRAAGEVVELAPRPDEPPLRVQLTGGAAPYHGCAIVERAFRIAATRSIWVREIVPIERDGTITFGQRVRIPGERPAAHPVAREESYRVTVHAASFEPLQRMLPPGRSTLGLTESAWRPRRVLAARAEPAKLPIRATYSIAGEEVVVDLDEAAVPLLGDIEPLRVTTGSGDVELDPWDPDVPLFVVDAGAARDEEPNAQVPAAVDGLDGVVELSVLDAERRGQYGAAVWLENRGVKRAGTDSDLFAVTDSQGIARLEKLPTGTFSLLVRHPEAGFAEVVADVTTVGARREVVLNPAPAPEPEAVVATGTILLDLGGTIEDDDVGAAVGTFEGTRVSWLRFPHRPKHVRLEGLTPGPTNFFARVGDGPVHFGGGVLSGTLEDPAVDPFAYPATRFSLRILDADGQPAQNVGLSLGDRAGRADRPRSTELFSLEPQPDGTLTTEVHVHGNLWVRVWADGHEPGGVLLTEGEGTTTIEHRLEKTPPPPEEGDGNGAPTPDDKGGEKK